MSGGGDEVLTALSGVAGTGLVSSSAVTVSEDGRAVMELGTDSQTGHNR